MHEYEKRKEENEVEGENLKLEQEWRESESGVRLEVK